ncbi:hypothetical protein BGHDH14_bgh04043 [Blumeria hordei DH14]|uniref:Uncharacterized protein n=1 Tax=Blumeria graminis f. sp. hordei (strain DH14) TaxID=546991 RepID=N1JA03_BLUG1|nr:hypothetical protein BGHDH14_bgh04043 [Blumeria hordei DH14]
MSNNNDSVKNRKRRNTKNLTQPSKRLQFEFDNPITVEVRQEAQCPPIIASSPGLQVSSSTILRPYVKPLVKARKENASLVTQEMLLHSAEHPKIDYTAKDESLGVSEPLVKHYIGLYNPKSGKLEVTEARRMIIRGTVKAHSYEDEQETILNNIREQRNILGQTFGTKKARRAIASAVENAISPDLYLRNSDGPPVANTATVAMLANMAETTKDMNSRAALAKIADEGKPRPRANEDATSVQDVYTIDSLIGEDILKMLPIKEWQDKLKVNEEIFLRSKFVASRIQKYTNDYKMLKVLRFALLLIQIYQSSRSSREGKRLPRRDELKDIVGDIPEAVLGNVKQKFSEDGIINKYRCDLLITHLCVISLIVDNFETDTSDLKEDLQLELSQITKYFAEVGAKSTALGKAETTRLGKSVASQRRLAKLKLPLTFPKLSYGGRKK